MGNSRIGPRVFLVASGVMFAIALFLAVVVGQLNTPDAALLALGSGANLVACIYSYTGMTLGALGDPGPMSHPETDEDTAFAIASEDIDEFVPYNGASRLSSGQVLAFAACVVDSRRHFTRISEHVESYHRSTLIRSTYTVRLHSTAEEGSAEQLAADSELTPTPMPPLAGFIIPLHLPEKGALIDGLRVFDGAGKRVSTIDTRTQSAFVAACFRVLTRMASPRARDQYLDAGRKRELMVLDVLRSSNPAEVEIKAAKAMLERLDSSSDAQPYLILAADLLGELSAHSPISVAVSQKLVDENPWPSTLRFVLERRMVAPIEMAPGQQPLAQRAYAKLDSVRLALAVRLNRVYFPLDAASRTPSYHLEVEGPPGTYFAGGELLEPQYESGDYRMKVQDLRGQRRAHLHLSDTKARKNRFYGAQFYERAPGSFASTVVASIVSTILITTLGLMNVLPLPPGTPDRTSSMVPALLALPIAIAAFIGLEGSTGKRHPSLLSRFVALSITALSLVAFICALVKDVSSTTWWTLMFASATLTVVAVLSWTIRLKLEANFVKGNN